MNWRLCAIRHAAVCRIAVRIGVSVNPKVVVRLAAACVGPAHRHFNGGAGMRGHIAVWQIDSQHVVIAGLNRIIALRTDI